MRRKNAETIGQVLRQFLRQEGLETPLNQHRIIDQWYALMGEGVAAYTGEVYIRNQCLYVQIMSPALRDTLMMDCNRLDKRLNEAVGAQVITRVMFR